MKRFILSTLTTFFILFVTGFSPADSVKVYFDVNRSQFNQKLSNNRTNLDSLIHKVRKASTLNNLDHIQIYSFASPEGPITRNEELYTQRANTLSELIINRTGINQNLIKKFTGSEAWEELRNLVIANPDVPSRAKVLEILNKVCKAQESNDVELRRKASEKAKAQLSKLDKGIPYKWMLKNLYPQLRSSLAVIVYSQSPETIMIETPKDSIDSQPFNSGDLTAQYLGIYPPPFEYASAEIDMLDGFSRPYHLFALKTNLLYYAALMPNIQFEWLINHHWSVAANWDIAWWGKYSDFKSYRLSVISVEGRYWINPREPWHGFWVGHFGGAGWYDFENGGPGYYGDGWMSGLSLGYMWPISRNLSLEGEVGAGYMRTVYKKYIPFEGHHIYQLTKSLSYWGPLKLRFSFVWRFGDRNKNKYQSTER